MAKLLKLAVFIFSLFVLCDSASNYKHRTRNSKKHHANTKKSKTRHKVLSTVKDYGIYYGSDSLSDSVSSASGYGYDIYHYSRSAATKKEANANIVTKKETDTITDCCAFVKGDACFCRTDAIKSGCACHHMISLSVVYVGDALLSHVKIYDADTKVHRCKYENIAPGDEIVCDSENGIFSDLTTLKLERKDGSYCTGYLDTSCKGHSILDSITVGCNDIVVTGYITDDYRVCDDGLAPCKCSPSSHEAIFLDTQETGHKARAINSDPSPHSNADPDAHKAVNSEQSPHGDAGVNIAPRVAEQVDNKNQAGMYYYDIYSDSYSNSLSDSYSNSMSDSYSDSMSGSYSFSDSLSDSYSDSYSGSYSNYNMYSRHMAHGAAADITNKHPHLHSAKHGATANVNMDTDTSMEYDHGNYYDYEGNQGDGNDGGDGNGEGSFYPFITATKSTTTTTTTSTTKETDDASNFIEAVPEEEVANEAAVEPKAVPVISINKDGGIIQNNDVITEGVVEQNAVPDINTKGGGAITQGNDAIGEDVNHVMEPELIPVINTNEDGQIIQSNEWIVEDPEDVVIPVIDTNDGKETIQSNDVIEVIEPQVVVPQVANTNEDGAVIQSGGEIVEDVIENVDGETVQSNDQIIEDVVENVDGEIIQSNDQTGEDVIENEEDPIIQSNDEIIHDVIENIEGIQSHDHIHDDNDDDDDTNPEDTGDGIRPPLDYELPIIPLKNQKQRKKSNNVGFHALYLVVAALIVNGLLMLWIYGRRFIKKRREGSEFDEDVASDSLKVVESSERDVLSDISLHSARSEPVCEIKKYRGKHNIRDKEEAPPLWIDVTVNGDIFTDNVIDVESDDADGAGTGIEVEVDNADDMGSDSLPLLKERTYTV